MKPAELTPRTDPIVGPGRVLSFEVDRSGAPTIFAATHIEGDDEGAVMAAVVGPGPADGRSLMRWLKRGCPDPAPQRQGFAAVLFRPNGHATAAVSARNEVALYFRYADGHLMGSSSLRGLVARLPQAPALDLQKLTDLCFEYDDPQRMWFIGVDRLPPSHVADFYPGRPPRIRRWFDPPVVPIGERPRDNAPDLMREAVHEAVEASLPVSGDVAASLSGGLDSTMVAATAASILSPQGRAVHGFTHVPRPGTESGRPGWIASDEDTVRDLTNLTAGLTYEPVVSAPVWNVVDALLEQFPLTLAPHRNFGNADWLLEIRRRVDRAGFALTLGGQSGNLGFSWKGIAGVDELLRHRKPLSAYRLAKQESGSVAGLKATMLAGFPRTADRWRNFKTGRSVEYWQWRDGLQASPSSEALEAWERLITARDFGRQPYWRHLLLSSASVRSVAQPPASISWRSDPLSDPELVRLVLGIHPGAWSAGNRDRSVAREAMRGVVPDSVRLRTDRGMQGADGHRRSHLDSTGLDAAFDMIDGSTMAGEFVDVDLLRAAAEHSRGKGQSAYAEWASGPGRLLGYALFAAWWDGFAASWRR